MSGVIDHRRLLDEIDAEVRRRRADPSVAALERDLDASFARFAPAPAAGTGFEAMLTRAQDASFVDASPAVVSSRTAVRRLKGLVHRAVGWEVRHVAVQVSAFAATLTEAVRLLGRRVDALEAARADPVDPFEPPAWEWAPVLAGVVAGPPGPVGLAGCGALAEALGAIGIDAVEVSGDPAGPFGALVLSGPAVRRPPAALAALARRAAAAVAPGGTVVVVDADPAAWAAARSPVEVDLGARPLHAATWRVLLADAGLEPAGDAPAGGAGAYAVVARRP
ncbi:MAG TPA: hypothetical protein VFJ85_17435 [Acidimicrobiales bacterium]|nr:hypothetical protein [Acidimicrobiales bacterium]